MYLVLINCAFVGLSEVVIDWTRTSVGDFLTARAIVTSVWNMCDEDITHLSPVPGSVIRYNSLKNDNKKQINRVILVLFVWLHHYLISDKPPTTDWHVVPYWNVFQAVFRFCFKASNLHFPDNSWWKGHRFLHIYIYKLCKSYIMNLLNHLVVRIVVRVHGSTMWQLGKWLVTTNLKQRWLLAFMKTNQNTQDR